MSRLPDLPNIKIRGPFWHAEAEVLRASLDLPKPSEILFTEDFQNYAENEDPVDWKDTKADNSIEEDTSLFKTAKLGDQIVFGTTAPNLFKVHSHYNAQGVLNWTNYVFAGKILMTNKNSGIGITFFSRYPENQDKYYRLSRDVKNPTFHLEAHPQGVQKVQGDIDSGLNPESNTWYCFHIEVEDAGFQTNIKAKVWQDGTEEPVEFQIVAYDDDCIRIISGTIGFWASGSGYKYFDGLKVQGAIVQLPTTPKVLLSQDFDDYIENEDPIDWKDTNEYDEEDASLFKTVRVEDNIAFGTISNQISIHSHYCAAGVLNWTNYIFTGRMYITRRNSGIGVTFLSRSPESLSKYYRLIRHGGKRTFRIEPHPASDQTIKGIVDSGIDPETNTWYHFHIEVEDAGFQTNIKAKIWQEGTVEPADYQIDAYDDSPFRLTYGTVGIYCTGTGYKYFDDLRVVGTGAATYNWAFRTLFVENKLREALRNKNLFLPGTLLTLCFVKSVAIMPGKGTDPTYSWKRKSTEKSPLNPSIEEIKSLLGNGDLSLFLLQANPSDWVRDENHLPEFTCLDGEINLDLFEPVDSARDKIYRALNLEQADPGLRRGAEALLGSLSVHSSGLSIYGKTFLPWEQEPVAAPFQLARLLPDPSISSAEDKQPGFHLTIDTERMKNSEKNAIVEKWNNLSVYLNPKYPLNAIVTDEKSPTWVTIEIADPTRVPRIYWEIVPWNEQPEVLSLHFERDEINLLLSDQQPYNKQRPPTSLARIVLDDISVVRSQNGRLKISVKAGSESDNNRGSLSYSAGLDTKSNWQETFVLANHEVEFSPVETPRFIRETQALEVPEWSPGDEPDPVQPSVLWGFMPLMDGWAQLPVPNLTEQIYLDAQLAQFEAVQSAKALIQGAVSFGNDRSSVLAFHNQEHPWNMTLTNVRFLKGEWELQPTNGTNGELKLNSISIKLFDPEVILNGVFWFSTGKPSTEDALPNFDNWISGLQSIPLRTAKPDTALFPTPLTLMINQFIFSLRQEIEIDPNEPPAAFLLAWSFLYQADPKIFKRMVEAHVLPDKTFSQYLPLIWRRHSFLPMIQALPLTQTKYPPNHPSSSRQLVPFELSTIADAENNQIDLPLNWIFITNSASKWLQFQGNASPAREWKSLFDLPLAALSLPGLVLDPNVSPDDTGLVQKTTDLLPMQFRFDLPYTDEVNALAQLPKVPPNPEEVSPLPDSPPPKPPKPLTRETFLEHWALLTERASLASADAVTTFSKQNGQTVIQGLIEPFIWPVSPKFELEQYPGNLEIENINQNQSAKMVLQTEAALRWIYGKFIDDGNGRIRRLTDDATDENPYLIEAGTMAAHHDGNGKYRDQRGLQREASSDTTKLVKTRVMLDGQNIDYELISALSRFELSIPGSDGWEFWFRDLPCHDGTFDRKSVISEEAEDINDPEAHSRERNYLNGYEWRLTDNATKSEFIPLFNLHFYPLTLEKVVIQNNEIERLEIIGRLQLPLAGGGELEEFSNAVRLTFEYDDTLEKPKPKFIAIILESEAGEWPLALSSGEADESPRLFWKKIGLNGDYIEIDDISLNFFLFNVEWSIQLEKLSFPTSGTEITQSYNFSEADPQQQLFPTRLELSIDLTDGEYIHKVSLILKVRLGNIKRYAFAAEVHFHFLGEEAEKVTWENAFLFDDMKLLSEEISDDDHSILFTENTLQFKWQQYKIDESNPLQLLPGMNIHSKKVPGFAVLTFEVLKYSEGIPKLQLTNSFIEAILFCQWGQFLQVEQLPSNPEISQVFGSSAGDLAFGYTAQWRDGSWDESFLLNGFLEVKNLISWPKAMNYVVAENKLTLPAARTTVETEQSALDHIRHTIRILFNQHQIPADLFVVGEGELLFNLAENKSWQFLAIVEHQLIDVSPDLEFSSIQLGFDRRWTTLQQVRIIFPTTFKQFLLAHKNDKIRTIDPVEGITWIGDANYGYLATGLRNRLMEENTPELDKLPPKTLLVEASAPHWIKQDPITDASIATTLQFMPNGSQLGIISSPKDYNPSDPKNPQWLLFTTPFLGRLQYQANDLIELQGEIPDTVSALQVDPVLRIHRNRAVSPDKPLASVPLAFSTWGDDNSVEITVSNFDTAVGRTWHRLDPISLEENWFRLQNPLIESQPERLTSVMFTLPDTPARLSRSTALRRAFDCFRKLYPPAPWDSYDLPPLVETDQIVWQRDSVMLMQGVSSIDINSEPPYGWHLLGLQIVTSNEFSKIFKGRRRYAAATLLPALLEIDEQENRIPLSFAVSPYLGVDFKPSGDESKLSLRLVSSELLCLDRASGTLLPAASHLWELTNGENIFENSQKWAEETHRRLCPDSPAAILRFREIRENTNNVAQTEAPLTMTYSFSIVSNIQRRRQLARRVFRIRSAVSQLRFREGQFGGNEMPENVQTFEIAPPQVIGVQPIYLIQHPASNNSNYWPWGLSSLRMSVHYSEDKKAIIGHSGTNNSMTLWWQAPQYFVQYRSALSSVHPTAGLPPLFRATAIKSFLPVLPTPPLPFLRSQALIEFSALPIQRWQSVLLGAIRYWMLGDRPGVMFAIRHQLLRQNGLDLISDESQRGNILVSGSIPVQHRMPRPMPVPQNTENNKETALQTWASYFEPQRNLLVRKSPADEAFLAQCGSSLPDRLQMKLEQPVYGAISTRWDGTLIFNINFEKKDAAWNQLTLELVDNGQTIEYDQIDLNEPRQYTFKLVGEKLNELQQWLNSKIPGDTILARAKIKTQFPGFFQTLSFLLRLSGESALPLPLKPYFILFEDPEYNRRLASPSTHSSGIVKVGQEIHTVTLAVDRREYNPNSLLSLRYDWDDNVQRGLATIEVQRIVEGIPTDLSLPETDKQINPGQLRQLSFLRIQTDNNVKFSDGETLQIKLKITKAENIEEAEIFLKVDILEVPVIPVPEAAYALLRWQAINGENQVECVRFAWGPEASRIELICPEDLRTEVVRRRAVFQWTDSARPGTVTGYAIQKIMPNGSTHFPAPELIE